MGKEGRGWEGKEAGAPTPDDFLHDATASKMSLGVQTIRVLRNLHSPLLYATEKMYKGLVLYFTLTNAVLTTAQNSNPLCSRPSFLYTPGVYISLSSWLSGYVGLRRSLAGGPSLICG